MTTPGVNKHYELIDLKGQEVFYEEVANVSFYNSHWQVITSISLADMSNSTEFVKFSIKQMEYLCNQFKLLNTTKLQEVCVMALQDASRYLSSIVAKEHELEQVFYGGSRRKREVVDGVGRMFKYLFGVMDDQDATNIKEKIEILEKDDEMTFNLLKQQISVVNSNYNKIKKPMMDLQNATNTIMEKTNSLIDKYNSLQYTVGRECLITDIQREVTSMSTTILYRILDLQQEQNTAISILNALRVHKLPPLVIKTQELRDLILKFPSTLNHYFKDPHHLNQLFEIDFFEGRKQILIRIKIPLVENTIFNLNKIYLLPTQQTPNDPSTLQVLQYNNEYLAGNKEEQKFILLSQSQVNQCKSVIINFNEEIYVCKQTSPTFLGSKHHCLILRFFNPFLDSANCTRKKLPNFNDKIVKLIHPDSWLFICQYARNFLLNCDKTVSKLTLSGTVILSFKDNCRLISREFDLPIAGKSVSGNLKIKPSELIMDYTYPIITKTNYTTKGHSDIPLLLSTYSTHNNELLETDKDLQSLQHNLTRTESERSKLHEKISSQHFTVSIISGVTFTIILLAITLFVCYFARYRSLMQNLASDLIKTNAKVSRADIPEVSTIESQLSDSNVDRLHVSPQLSTRFFRSVSIDK